MTEAEARIIGNIVGTADGGCAHCIRNLVDRLNKAFPQFVWQTTDEPLREMPEWSDDPEDIGTVGYVVAVTPSGGPLGP